jgi:hypothetical protein
MRSSNRYAPVEPRDFRQDRLSARSAPLGSLFCRNVGVLFPATTTYLLAPSERGDYAKNPVQVSCTQQAFAHRTHSTTLGRHLLPTFTASNGYSRKHTDSSPEALTPPFLLRAPRYYSTRHRSRLLWRRRASGLNQIHSDDR